MSKIHIITISDGNPKSLKLTLNSIDKQNFKDYKNLIISKKKLKKKNNKKRFFFHETNGSIYGAMNYGLNKSKNKFIIFLNAGDTFFSESSLKKIYYQTNNFKTQTCIMMISILKYKTDYFIPKKKIFFSKNFLTHSSFIGPKAKNNNSFNIDNKINADGEWMKNNIMRYDIIKKYEPLTIFYLGGISNFPSMRTLKLKINTGMINIFKELFKFLLLKVVGNKFFYRTIYYFKYDRVNFYKIKKFFDRSLIRNYDH